MPRKRTLWACSCSALSDMVAREVVGVLRESWLGAYKKECRWSNCRNAARKTAQKGRRTKGADVALGSVMRYCMHAPQACCPCCSRTGQARSRCARDALKLRPYAGQGRARRSGTCRDAMAPPWAPAGLAPHEALKRSQRFGRYTLHLHSTAPARRRAASRSRPRRARRRRRRRRCLRCRRRRRSRRRPPPRAAGTPPRRSCRARSRRRSARTGPAGAAAAARPTSPRGGRTP
jgi:hypothetical protein